MEKLHVYLWNGRTNKPLYTITGVNETIIINHINKTTKKYPKTRCLDVRMLNVWIKEVVVSINNKIVDKIEIAGFGIISSKRYKEVV